MIKLSSCIKLNDSSKIPHEYQCALFDSSVKNPFLLSDGLMRRMDIIKKQHSAQYDLAKGIFTYLRSHIKYGFVNKKKSGYGTSLDVWKNKEGICGEMSFLYTTLARYCSLESSCVIVTKDANKKKVHHMCSQVGVPEPLLVDIAYNSFDIKHKSYMAVNDARVLEMYSSWRK
jgi:hypothetical protein